MGLQTAGLLGFCAVLLAGCALDIPHSSGMADRCADVMRLAMPFAKLDIGNGRAQSTGIEDITAAVDATRTDLPADSPLPRQFAAECKFSGGALVGFRWTKGPNAKS